MLTSGEMGEKGRVEWGEMLVRGLLWSATTVQYCPRILKSSSLGDCISMLAVPEHAESQGRSRGPGVVSCLAKRWVLQ